VADHRHVIAIDGPAAAGKSTVAKMVADHLDALLFDTGALYRAVAFVALRLGVPAHDEAGLTEIARASIIDIRPISTTDGRHYDVWLNGEDVTWDLRSPDVGAIVSRVSEHPGVREALLPLQRQIAQGHRVIMVGRDIGTVVVPDAGLKIFLDATPGERARRRYEESLTRGSGETFADVLQETLRRDSIDQDRRAAPLRAADDAIRIDTDRLSAGEVVSVIESLARSLRDFNGKPLWPT
jgi:CMP/dCMP kinase